MQVINMGETALDEDTFNEYLEEMKEHYTAEKVSTDRHIVNLFDTNGKQYHLLGNLFISICVFLM